MSSEDFGPNRPPPCIRAAELEADVEDFLAGNMNASSVEITVLLAISQRLADLERTLDYLRHGQR